MNFKLKKEVDVEVKKLIQGLEKIGFLVTHKPMIDVRIDDVWVAGKSVPDRNIMTYKGRIVFVIPDDLIELEK